MDSMISSAFWFASNEPGGWWTEIDVIEYSTSQKKNQFQKFNMNTHMHRNGDNPKMKPVRNPKTIDVGYNLSEHPIKMGLDWTKDYITWRVLHSCN